MEIVIDTNIWIKACRMQEFSMNCNLFIANFLQNKEDYLALDQNGEMMGEYEDNLRKNPCFRQYVNEMYRKGKMAYASSDIPARFLSGLDKVNFHEPEDRVFLGRAFHADKYLVTEDSDYGCSPIKEKNDEHALAKKNFIENEMKIVLSDSEQALKDSQLRLGY